MAIQRSLQMTPPTYPVSGPGSGGRSVKIERGYYLGAGAVADTIQLFKLHPRFRVTGGYIKNDANGASVTISVGDAGNPARYWAATAITTAAVTQMTAATGIDYLNPAYTVVFATIAGGALNGTGAITVVITGIVEEPE